MCIIFSPHYLTVNWGVVCLHLSPSTPYPPLTLPSSTHLINPSTPHTLVIYLFDTTQPSTSHTPIIHPPLSPPPTLPTIHPLILPPSHHPPSTPIIHPLHPPLSLPSTLPTIHPLILPPSHHPSLTLPLSTSPSHQHMVQC